MPVRGRYGRGRLKVVNRSAEEAVAMLARSDAPSTALRLVYIQPHTEAYIEGIAPGVFIVSFSFGALTDKHRVSTKAVGPLQFVEVQSVDGYHADQYEIRLQPEG